MQWVLIALVVLIVSVLVTALHRVMEAVKSMIYVPPSDANIDQWLPEEIMEQIFSLMDPLTLLQSHNVSRYWRNHASKNRVKSIVLDTYVKSVQREIPGIEEHWIDYKDKYVMDTRLRDISLAQKHGKQLLELKYDKPIGVYGYPLLGNENRFIVKMSAAVSSVSESSIQIHIGNKYLPTSNQQIRSLLTNEGNPLKYEVMVTLDDFVNVRMATNFIMFRNTNPKKWLGFIPLDSTFLQVMIYLTVPLIVHDSLYSESFINILKQWFGTVAFLVLNGLTVMENLNMVQYYRDYRNATLYKKLVIGTSIAAVILFVLFYPASSTNFTLVGVFVGTFIYGFSLHEHCFGENWTQPKDRRRLQLFLICMTLILLTNDWSMTIRSAIDGALWYRLFWNTVHFVFFGMYAIWIGVLSSVLQDRSGSWSWKYFINWEREIIKLMARVLLLRHICNALCSLLAIKSHCC